MRKKLLVTLLVIVVLVAGFAVVVALQPSEYHVARHVTISAPPAAVFPHVNDLHKWDVWSPWAKLDPNADSAFEGSDAGEGAIFRWAGNEEIGKGSMTIVASRPDELIGIRLDFIEPFEDTSNVQFTFEPEGDQTVVTWSMDGQNNFVEKAMCMFMDMDKMIGGKFEEGLASLKAVVEAAPEKAPDASSEATSSESNAEQ